MSSCWHVVLRHLILGIQQFDYTFVSDACTNMRHVSDLFLGHM